MSLLYAGSIVAWFLAARAFGTRAALLTVAVLVAYPGYGILFHELSSDSVVAAAFAGWALLTVRVMTAPSARGFALVGAGVGVLALIRPANQILLVLALLPLLAIRGSWRPRVIGAVAFVVPAVALMGAWTLHNGLRYDNYTLARGGNATVPFYRAFVTDKIVEPSNGPASRELALAVQRNLLTKEPYRSYGIDLQRFFSEASSRMQEDLVALSDRTKGWKSNHRWLRDVGVEAVRAHPRTYARGVTKTLWGMLTQSLFRSPAPARDSGGSSSSDEAGGETVVINGRTLPKPTEGEAIPAAHEGGVATPDGSIYTVWTSPSQHHLVFVHPGDEQRYIALHRRMNELQANLPGRAGSPTLAHRLNQVSRWFPPPLLWLALGLVALALLRPRRTLALAAPAAAGLIVIVLSSLGLPAEPHYSVPMSPAFVLLAAGALFGPRLELGGARSYDDLRRRLAPALPLAGIAVAVIAAAWAGEIYATKIHGAFHSHQAPPDLGVFLSAAGRVLHGASPYAFNGDRTYAYPPLVALLVAPLHPLSVGVATLVWTLAGLAAVCGALRLLGVRDVRCYALALVYPVTKSAVGLGTIGPLLLLAVALAWHWRDRIGGAVAAGTAVALKLFLWPLVPWLALTRRWRLALFAVTFGLGLALIPWAAVGLDGLRGYPGLLRHLSRDEATSSYSVVALAARAHLPEAVGYVLSFIAAVALLFAASRVARDERLSERERDVATLTLALAAGLAASPIVWVHYFLLLLVPLALARPRFSVWWFVPFAYYPLGEHAWPAGNAWKLGLALVTTLVILAMPLAGYLRAPLQRSNLLGRRGLTAGSPREQH
jgi:hypothetical protein